MLKGIILIEIMFDQRFCLLSEEPPSFNFTCSILLFFLFKIEKCKIETKIIIITHLTIFAIQNLFFNGRDLLKIHNTK